MLVTEILAMVEGMGVAAAPLESRRFSMSSGASAQLDANPEARYSNK